MNQRKEIPAKGIRCSAVATDWELVCNQVPASSGSWGSDSRSNHTLAISSNEKRMPAMAAARGARRNCAAVVAESGGIIFARTELSGKYGLRAATDPDQEKALCPVHDGLLLRVQQGRKSDDTRESI